MNIQFTCIVDLDSTDIRSYDYLYEGFKLLNNVIYNRHIISFQSTEHTLKFLNDSGFDKVCDVHVLCIVYHKVDFALKLKNTDKIVYFYIGDEDIPHATIQNIVETNGIICPYTIRPYFKQVTLEILKKEYEKDIDVLWCGSESYPMKNWPGTRKDWLDEFEYLANGKFKFYRRQKLYHMEDYAKLIKKSKIVLHIRGLAEHCFRFFETMYLGSCLIAQSFNKEKLWKKPEHVPWFYSPKEACNICIELIKNGEWQNLATQQANWYTKAYSEEELLKWGIETADLIVKS